jgi:hypothetical protein
MDIQKLRAMRNNDFSKIASEFEKIANPGEKKSYDDDRIWKLTPDKAGNASAVIRFLPRTEGDELPFVKIFSHSFQGPTGKWYIENSLTTLGENDPVGELNSKLWNSGSEANKEIARKQKRKLSFIANVYIVNDPAKPENNGQVKLFKFGKKIFDKIMDKARPTFAEDQPVNVFDLWEGADFKLRMRKVDGYPNYDQSIFADPAALLSGDEEQLLEVVGKQHRLAEFTDRKNFKTYEELQRKLNDVLNDSGSSGRSAASIAEEDDDYVAPVAPKTVASKPAPEPKVAKNTAPSEDDDEDVMSYFQKIANES